MPLMAAEKLAWAKAVRTRTIPFAVDIQPRKYP